MYLDAVVCIFLQDLLRVFVRVEGVHEHQGHVCVVSLVKVLQDIKKKTHIHCVHTLKMIRDCFVSYQQNINDIKQSDHLFKSLSLNATLRGRYSRWFYKWSDLSQHYRDFHDMQQQNTFEFQYE